MNKYYCKYCNTIFNEIYCNDDVFYSFCRENFKFSKCRNCVIKPTPERRFVLDKQSSIGVIKCTPLFNKWYSLLFK